MELGRESRRKEKKYQVQIGRGPFEFMTGEARKIQVRDWGIERRIAQLEQQLVYRLGKVSDMASSIRIGHIVISVFDPMGVGWNSAI